MQEIWERIHQGFAIHAPKLISCLQPGAAEEEIEHTEKLLGIQFPADVRASYRIHNGMSGSQGFIDNWPELYSLSSILEQWDCWRDLLEAGEFLEFESEPKGPIKTDWWNIKWIPLLGNRGGDHCCLDLDPPPDGQLGQIITMWHDIGAEEIIAPSFKKLLATLADDLNAGGYIFSEEFGELVTVTEFEERNVEQRKQEHMGQLGQFLKRAQFIKQYGKNSS